jgi:hypothetical protein
LKTDDTTPYNLILNAFKASSWEITVCVCVLRQGNLMNESVQPLSKVLKVQAIERERKSFQFKFPRFYLYPSLSHENAKIKEALQLYTA